MFKPSPVKRTDSSRFGLKSPAGGELLPTSAAAVRSSLDRIDRTAKNHHSYDSGVSSMSTSCLYERSVSSSAGGEVFAS